jgi:hypothetical protein
MYAERALNSNLKQRFFMAESTKPKKGKIAHGLYAKDVLLSWDDPEQFDVLHNELKKEFFPSGPSEEECVLDLVLLYWRKRTLWRLQTATVLSDRFTEEIAATGKKSWTGIRQSLREKAREEHTLLQTMETTVAEAVSDMSRLVRKLARDPQSGDLSPALSAGLELFKKNVLPLLDEVRALPNAQGAFDKNYLPDALEKIVRLETSIDARINKVTARLVALKEFKRTPAGSGPLPQLTVSRSFGVSKQPGD